MRTPDTALRWIGGIFSILGVLFTALSVALLLLVPPEAIRSSSGRPVTTSWPLALPFLVVGVIFLCVGIPFLVRGFRSTEGRILRLMDTGERYVAEITGIAPASYRINYRKPWLVLCRYTDESGREWTCRSAPLWEKPVLSGSTVPVYRDARNPRRYYVDLADVLETPAF